MNEDYDKREPIMLFGCRDKDSPFYLYPVKGVEGLYISRTKLEFKTPSWMQTARLRPLSLLERCLRYLCSGIPINSKED